jgi:hypothetical protein
MSAKGIGSDGSKPEICLMPLQLSKIQPKGGQVRRIVIVDGYSTGRELVQEIVERNVECLHLRSSQQLPCPRKL